MVQWYAGSKSPEPILVEPQALPQQRLEASPCHVPYHACNISGGAHVFSACDATVGIGEATTVASQEVQQCDGSPTQWSESGFNNNASQVSFVIIL